MKKIIGIVSVLVGLLLSFPVLADENTPSTGNPPPPAQGGAMPGQDIHNDAQNYREADNNNNGQWKEDQQKRREEMKARREHHREEMKERREHRREEMKERREEMRQHQGPAPAGSAPAPAATH